MAAEHVARYQALRPRIREAIADRKRFWRAGRGLAPAWSHARNQAERGLTGWNEIAERLGELMDARASTAELWPEPERYKQPEGDPAKLAQALDRIASLTAAALAAGWLCE